MAGVFVLFSPVNMLCSPEQVTHPLWVCLLKFLIGTNTGIAVKTKYNNPNKVVRIMLDTSVHCGVVVMARVCSVMSNSLGLRGL